MLVYNFTIIYSYAYIGVASLGLGGLSPPQKNKFFYIVFITVQLCTRHKNLKKQTKF